MRKKRIRWGLLIAVLLGFYFILPRNLFDTSYSTLLLDSSGVLLSARIADDGQWRFPQREDCPEKVKTCIRYFEDEYFHYHLGVNPVALSRALWQNISSGKIKSGGSTISMQVIRLSRGNPRRTYLEKIWEILLAIRMELSYNKEEILAMYTAHAPYGGNVVGIETASWRYFARPLEKLSWAESAMLAVLPNSPSLIHLGKNRDKLKKKRDRLLKKLQNKGVINEMTYSLSVMEPIPENPKALPNKAYHLLSDAIGKGKKGSRVLTHLDARLQADAKDVVDRYSRQLAQNEIDNACAIILDLRTMELRAYVGNSSNTTTRSPFVDICKSARSSGSILKPILYGKAYEEGLINSLSLIRDVPIAVDEFAPKNFDGAFDGVVPAHEALYRSLNVPAMLLLRDYGPAIFRQDLRNLGFKTVNRSVTNYGLTLILGGAEVRLTDLAEYYGTQARTLTEDSSRLAISRWQGDPSSSEIQNLVNPGAWWIISQNLTQVARPGLRRDWAKYTSGRKIAWKTGTSQGFRDAWAVGYDPNYLVAVWVGNADGEGRPGLTGVSAAGPLMFNLFELLPRGGWFEKPEIDIKKNKVCARSGFLPTPQCPILEINVSYSSRMDQYCTFHEKALLDEHNHRVTRDCGSGVLKDTVLFVLDPIASYYHLKRHSNSYFPVPWSGKCRPAQASGLGIVYPHPGAKIVIPKNFKGGAEQILFRAVHPSPKGKVFWHLNEEYLGSTEGKHELKVFLKPGSHTLSIIDEQGQSKVIRFSAVEL